jgi:hypothetical protein
MTPVATPTGGLLAEVAAGRDGRRINRLTDAHIQLALR